jgi:hypothetical protein
MISSPLSFAPRFAGSALSVLLAGALLSLSLGLLGCASDDDDDTGECSGDDLYLAEHCDEEYCGDPVVRMGTGGTGFEAVVEGQDMPIWYGSQGGYHIYFSVEMESLCPVVFVRISMQLEGEDGSLVSVHDQQRHVMAYRSPQETSSLQSYWGITGFVPCEYWPDDPDHPVSCPAGAGSLGHLEEAEIVMRVEVEDHNGRIGVDEKRVQPICCSS